MTMYIVYMLYPFYGNANIQFLNYILVLKGGRLGLWSSSNDPEECLVCRPGQSSYNQQTNHSVQEVEL